MIWSTLPAGREPDELPPGHAGHPVAAIRVDRTAVGPAGETVRVDEHPPIADGAIVEVVVAGPDGPHAGLGIGEIERAPVRAEGAAVGHGELVEQHLAAPVRPQPVERRHRRAWAQRHGAGDEPAGWVGRPVIEPVIRLVGLGIDDRLERAGGGIVEVEAVLQRHHHAAAGAQREAAEPRRQRPAAIQPGAGIKAMQRATVDVRPPQHLFAPAPQGCLAYPRLGVQHTVDTYHACLPAASLFAEQQYDARAPTARPQTAT